MKKEEVYIRAIRIRTVDLLGKTDQMDYYRNDSNCFKDPTCEHVVNRGLVRLAYGMDYIRPTCQ